MKKPLIALMLSFLSYNSFAIVKFKEIPLNKISGIRCNHHGANGSYTTDFQITTSSLNNSSSLDFQYLDSTKGDNHGSVNIRSVETAEGGGNNAVTYAGDIAYSSGSMFKGVKNVALIINRFETLPTSPSKFLSQLSFEKADGKEIKVKLPGWTEGTQLYCEFVPLK